MQATDSVETKTRFADIKERTKQARHLLSQMPEQDNKSRANWFKHMNMQSFWADFRKNHNPDSRKARQRVINN